MATGIRKEEAHIDEWARDIAPSTELRKWFGYDPEKWPAFERRYKAELNAKKHLLEKILADAEGGHHPRLRLA